MTAGWGGGGSQHVFFFSLRNKENYPLKIPTLSRALMSIAYRRVKNIPCPLG